jgi:hypothetical protein
VEIYKDFEKNNNRLWLNFQSSKKKDLISLNFKILVENIEKIYIINKILVFKGKYEIKMLNFKLT